MRAHILQHVPFEGPAYIGQWLAGQGAEISDTRLWESTTLPDPDAIDLLVVMGGPMSVNDEADFPWLAAEKRFIAELVARGRPVLGICLGAQLIASAHGARVFRNTAKEIGWFDIQAADGVNEGFRFPKLQPCCTGTARPSSCRRARACSPPARHAGTRPFSSASVRSACSSTSR